MNIILQADQVNFKDIIRYPQVKIQEGKTTFICGDSGCGKSTLLKLFNGTASPLSGCIQYRGENIAEKDMTRLRKEVLLISQSPYLFDASIKENFLEFYRYREEEPPTEAEMLEFLNLCCIDFPLEQDCSRLSGGERQRVFLAVFLSFRPKVLLMDEPTSALDEATGRKVIGSIRDFCRKQGITPVIVSHDLTLAEIYGEEKIILESPGKKRGAEHE